MPVCKGYFSLNFPLFLKLNFVWHKIRKEKMKMGKEKVCPCRKILASLGNHDSKSWPYL